MPGDIKRVLSDDARKRFREILDDVEHRGGVYEISRYRDPAAVLVPPEWFALAQAAVSLLADDTTVALTVPTATQAGRLRRLVSENRAVGLPFPSNAQPTWLVIDRETGDPVNIREIPSVAAEVASNGTEWGTP